MLYFGIIEGLVSVTIWWFIAVVVLLFGSYRCSVYADDEKVGALTFSAILLIVAIHLLGIFDVVSFVMKTPVSAAIWVAGYLAFGFFIYMPIRGIAKLKSSKAEVEEAIRRRRREFFDNIRRDLEREAERREALSDDRFPVRLSAKTLREIETQLNSAENLAKWEAERERYKKEILSVEREKTRIFYWSFAWFPDAMYKGVFQFVHRIRDIWNFLFGAIRGTLQRVINREMADVGNDI